MLLTQKFHSLQEFDPEFVPAVESLVRLEWPSFDAWLEAEKSAPAEDTFSYWLFFGPHHNSPVGVAQVQFKKLNTRVQMPWWKKITSVFDPSLSKWRMAHWQIGTGLTGAAIVDSRYEKEANAKLLEIFHEVNAPSDVISVHLTQSTRSPWKPDWTDIHHQGSTQWKQLRPFTKKHQNYQDYVLGLPDSKEIQKGWKKLHKELGVVLGDFPTLADRQELFNQCPDLDKNLLTPFKQGLLTFQKDQKLLGVVDYHLTPHGTLFCSPAPFEPQGQELVDDLMYVQHAIMRSFESTKIAHLVITHKGRPLQLVSEKECQFFSSQGFGIQDMTETSWSRSPYVS